MTENVDQIITKIRTGQVDQNDLLEMLVDGSTEEKAQLALFIGMHRVARLLEPLKEAFEMELDAEIRSLYYWAICLIAPETQTEILIQWLLEEENKDAKNSMIESFLTFAERHDIPLETIKVVSEEKQKTLDLPTSYPQINVEEEAVLDLLNQFRPKIPVSLNRIANLLRIDLKEVERILEDLKNKNQLPGEYLHLEQVFIKDAKRSQKVKCASCGAWTSTYPCSECGGGKVCATCRLVIDMHEEILTCPHCQAPSHAKHLSEWIKIKGSCPSCKKHITQTMLQLKD